eukprot:4023743-Amphidinium_carterae.1
MAFIRFSMNAIAGIISLKGLVAYDECQKLREAALRRAQRQSFDGWPGQASNDLSPHTHAHSSTSKHVSNSIQIDSQKNKFVNPLGQNERDLQKTASSNYLCNVLVRMVPSNHTLQPTSMNTGRVPKYQK